jgi:hypothetical protein
MSGRLDSCYRLAGMSPESRVHFHTLISHYPEAPNDRKMQVVVKISSLQEEKPHHISVSTVYT